MLTGVKPEMRIMQEEIFGPVLPIVTVDSEEEALEQANDSRFGLGSSIWTRDRAQGRADGAPVESGMVWINDHSYTHGACQCSWGGVKESGLGRSHSKFGFYECVNVKLVSWEPGHDARLLVAALRRDARRPRSAPRRGCSTAATGRGSRRCSDGAVPLLKVGARTLRKGR